MTNQDNINHYQQKLDTYFSKSRESKMAALILKWLRNPKIPETYEAHIIQARLLMDRDGRGQSADYPRHTCDKDCGHIVKITREWSSFKRAISKLVFSLIP